MADVNVSGVKLTEEQVAWLSKVISVNPDWGTPRWGQLEEIARAVYDALPETP